MPTVAFKTGGTISVSGGTDLVLTPQGANAAGANSLLALGDSSFATRRDAVVKAKYPAVSKTSPGGYTHFRGHAVFHKPITCSDGLTTVAKVALEISYPPEASAAEVQELRDIAAQLAVSSALTSFWTTGSVAL